MRSVALTTVLSWAVCSCVLNANEGPSSFDEIRSAVKRWQSRLDFRCSYVLRSGHSATIDEARRGIFVDEKTLSIARGVYVKRGEDMRLSVKYLELWDQPPGRAPTLVSCDEATNGTVYVSYIPRYKTTDGKMAGGVVRVERRPELSDLAAGVASDSVITPLKPFLSDDIDPFGKFDSDDVVSMKKLPNNRLSITCDATVNGFRNRRTLSISLAHSTPILERLEDTMVDPRGQQSTAEARLLDFTECDGVPVARRVVFFVTVGSQIRLYEWRTKDLGDRTPRDEDFTIWLDRNTTVVGLHSNNNAEKRRTPFARTISPLTISIDDLIAESVPLGVDGGPRRENP